MFEEGLIFYFNPFYFSDGGGSKPKYFIVLRIVNDKIVLATLPSSQDFVPSYSVIKHGCIDIPEACFNCYVFEASKPICENNWSFAKTTFVYGQQLDEYDAANLKDIYPVENMDYRIVGKLTDEEFKKLSKCLSESPNVKRKYRKMLLYHS